jgi:hypothetical protein
MPSVHFAKYTSFMQSAAMLVTTCTPWTQSGAKANARKECLPCSQPNYRVCLTPISCCFNNFFETAHHNAPDVFGTICCQQLANLDLVTTILSKVSVPTQHSRIISLQALFEEDANTMSKPFFTPPMYDVTLDDYSVSNGESHVSENSRPSQQAQASNPTAGVTLVEPTVTAGTNQCGQVCTMSQRMADSVSQQDFFGNHGMHYMALQSNMSKTDEDLFHNSHLQLLEQMRNPVTFHAEMMGDIMCLQQALRQPDAKEFVQAAIKEVNRHMDCNNWTLQKRYKVYENVQIMPSVWALQGKRDLTTNKIKSHKARLNLHWQKASLWNELF